jgi:hypothetical protein
MDETQSGNYSRENFEEQGSGTRFEAQIFVFHATSMKRYEGRSAPDARSCALYRLSFSHVTDFHSRIFPC